MVARSGKEGMMPTPSLAEVVIGQMTVILDCLDRIKGAESEPNKSLVKAMVFACNEAERVAKRRMELSDYEAVRRGKQQLLDDLHAVIPHQAG
jgi:hypothetical protein